MARTKEINIGKGENGIIEIELSHWKHFPKLMTRDLLQFPSYIYRGQTNYSWKLESSFDRLARDKKLNIPNLSKHLNAFKNAAKERRGENPQLLENDNEWWALAQHYGLATPLLDFTRSAFVALYFAFWDESFTGKYRSVYAIHAHRLKGIMKAQNDNENIDQKIYLFYPNTDGNERLINQSGLFLKMPVKLDVEKYVNSNFKGIRSGALLKIKIPNTELVGCLTMLNKMNINHSTLFPDLFGAAKFVNCVIDKPRYDYLANLNLDT